MSILAEDNVGITPFCSLLKDTVEVEIREVIDIDIGPISLFGHSYVVIVRVHRYATDSSSISALENAGLALVQVEQHVGHP